MPEIILYQPEIPPNTGNIIRLCANARTRLHLIEPLGFMLDDARVRRAGLDYVELTEVHTHRSWDDYRARFPEQRVWAFSTGGSRLYSDVSFAPDDGLLFGPETRGLPQDLLRQLGRERILRVPMQQDSRSLNLSNTVAIVLYESLRQTGFDGLG